MAAVNTHCNWAEISIVGYIPVGACFRFANDSYATTCTNSTVSFLKYTGDIDTVCSGNGVADTSTFPALSAYCDADAACAFDSYKMADPCSSDYGFWKPLMMDFCFRSVEAYYKLTCPGGLVSHPQFEDNNCSTALGSLQVDDVAPDVCTNATHPAEGSKYMFAACGSSAAPTTEAPTTASSNDTGAPTTASKAARRNMNVIWITALSALVAIVSVA